MHHIPAKIGDYVREHFSEEGLLIDINERNDEHGRLCYYVDLTQDDFVHHLVFDKNGTLLNISEEPLFPQDPHEDFFPGDEFGREY